MNNANIYEIGDILELRKVHPCGEKRWVVVKTVVTYKLEFLGCKRQILIDRVEMAKKVKKKLS